MQNPRDWPCCISVPETGGRFSRNRVATVNTLWISRRNRWKPVDHSPALASPISMIGEVGLPELHRQLTTGNWQLATGNCLPLLLELHLHGYLHRHGVSILLGGTKLPFLHRIHGASLEGRFVAAKYADHLDP